MFCLRSALAAWVLGVLTLLSACDSADTAATAPAYVKSAPTQERQLYLAIHPLHNPKKLFQAYQPYVDYLNANLKDVRIELEASRDYQAYEEKFRARKPDLILPNPWQTLEAIKVGYHVIAMAGEADDFKGIFLVRKNSDIHEPGDLKGKVVAYPSHTALAACIMPQRYLHDHGINIQNDITNRYVGSQESAIMNTFLGEAAAGATWPPPWRLFQRDRPEEASQLKVIWETHSLVNNSLMVRDDFDKQLATDIQKLTLKLHTHEAGQAILKSMETAQFFPADDATYNVVKDFVADFERDVRHVETP